MVELILYAIAFGALGGLLATLLWTVAEMCLGVYKN